jgi:hypothetical protein
MNILILNISLNWVYRLYKEYILSIKEIINKHYINNISINIIHIDIENNKIDINDIEESLNKLIKCDSEFKYDNEKEFHKSPLNIKDYNKIFYTGNIEILNLLLKINNTFIEKIYYINIEQMSNPSYYKMIRRIDGLKNIIDYSEENIPYFNNIYSKIYLLPPYFNFKNNVKKNMKCIDILSIVNNEYREKEISKIKITSKQKIKLLKNCFDDIRDDYFSKTKIYINLHCSSEHNTMEMIRIVNLIMHKVIILTQPSICTNLIFLKKYLFICNNSDEFTYKIQDILRDYDIYYNKIYGDFNKAEYKKYILECYEELFNVIS